MFWGCFSKHGTGPLVSIKGSVDQYEYLSILKDELIPELNRAKQAIPGTWGQRSLSYRKSVKSFLARKRVQLIEWPPYSPDLNPIENLWQWMKHVLETEFPVRNSADDIEDRIFSIWRTITPEMCGTYCENYEKRLLAVIQRVI